MNTIDFTLNGNLFVTKSDISIIESCKFTGIQIPRFCYHESLSISGNCRMCLVELETTEKLVLACLTNIESGIEIITNSLSVKKARENVLEALLLNHPLDCPICDQGGECDLQDQTKIYGNFFNKIFSKRRGVEDKNFGSLIKTIMTRCIHCTRCVRYSTEILGFENLGTLNRGGLTEIGTYVSKYNESNISGNIIDLCPVGALTSKNNAFQTRPWELRSVETIDLTDSLGSSLFINFKETEIIRVLPKPNLVNGNLISNKARFSHDSLLNNRIYDLNKLSNKKWKEFLNEYVTLENIKKNILVVINESIDLKTVNRLKFLTYINNKIKLRSFSRFMEFNNSYLFSNDILDIYENENNNCSILLSSFIEVENEILNTKLRLKSLNQEYSVYSTNRKYKSKNFNTFVNLNLDSIVAFLEGKSSKMSKYIIEKSPNFIVGESFKKRFLNSNYLKFYLNTLNNKISKLFINSSCNTETNYFLGIKSLNTRDLLIADLFFFIHLNENTVFNKCIGSIQKDIFVLTSYFYNTTQTNYLIPAHLKNFEISGIFINLEHRFQKTQKIFNSSSIFNGLDILVNTFFKNFKCNFKYLNFINESYLTIKNHLTVNLFFKSLLRKKTKKPIISFISTYPIKMSFQDITKTDSFLNNSYTINISSLISRFNFF